MTEVLSMRLLSCFHLFCILFHMLIFLSISSFFLVEAVVCVKIIPLHSIIVIKN